MVVERKAESEPVLRDFKERLADVAGRNDCRVEEGEAGEQVRSVRGNEESRLCAHAVGKNVQVSARGLYVAVPQFARREL